MTKLQKKRRRTKRIHVNQQVIKANRKNGTTLPVITTKTYKENAYGHEVKINGPCTIVYRPNKPLSCGAQVWIETKEEVTVFELGKGVTANL